MNRTEFEQLTTVSASTISGKDLTNKTPRTLLYGYTSNRNTWHVYLDDKGEIHVLVYSSSDYEILHRTYVDRNSDFVPDKRLYPERCDLEFCQRLKSAAVHLPFTTYTDVDNRAKAGGYCGNTLEDLTPSKELDNEALDDATAAQTMALLIQASLELGIIFHEESESILVPKDSAEEVLQRAKLLQQTAEYQQNSEVISGSRAHARALLDVIGSYGYTSASDVTVRGGLFQCRYELDQPSPDAEALTQRGWLVEEVAKGFRKLSKDGLTFYQQRTHRSKTLETGTLMQHLFGNPEVFRNVIGLRAHHAVTA